MKNNKKETTFIDLEDLRSEYESTYLHYFLNNPISFEEWLKKEKGIIFIKKIKNKQSGGGMVDAAVITLLAGETP